jgi:hypothetical protein
MSSTFRIKAINLSCKCFGRLTNFYPTNASSFHLKEPIEVFLNGGISVISGQKTALWMNVSRSQRFDGLERQNVLMLRSTESENTPLTCEGDSGALVWTRRRELVIALGIVLGGTRIPERKQDHAKTVYVTGALPAYEH